MNIKRPLSTMTLCKVKQEFLFYIFSVSNNQGFYLKFWEFFKSLGRRAQFFGPLKVKIHSNFDYDRALKQSLNVKNLIQH